MNRLLLIFPVAMALSLLAAQCGGPAPVQTVVVTREVEKVVTQEVEKEVIVTKEVLAKPETIVE
jgi:hypothetical protein